MESGNRKILAPFFHEIIWVVSIWINDIPKSFLANHIFANLHRI